MSKTPYTIVKAEIALNNMIDQAKTPGADLWAIEQEKRSFLASLQELITHEVKEQTKQIVQEIKVQQPVSVISSFQNEKGVSYERIERYSSHQGGSFDNFVRNMKTIPYAIGFSFIIVFAFLGFVNVALGLHH